MSHNPLIRRSLTRRSGLIKAVVAASVSALVLTACSSSDDSSASAAGSDPVSGGTMTVGVGNAIACIDPFTGFAPDGLAVTRTAVDSLVAQVPETGEIKPWLAESWTVNDDATRYEFTLKDGVTFSDGTPFDASVVKANIDYIKGLGAKASRPGYLAAYVSTEVVDPTTVAITFSAPSANFLAGLSLINYGMLSPASLDAGTEERCLGKFVGTGPFTVTDFVANQKIDVAKREGYTSAPGTATHDGDAYLDAITFTMMPEASVRNGALQSGQADMITGVSPQTISAVESSGATVEDAVVPGLPMNLMVRVTSDVTGDQLVRQALQVGIDRKTLVDTAVGAPFVPATSVVSSSTPGYSDNSDSLTFDADQANSLLDDAGWVMNSEGVREKGGKPLEMTLLYFTGLYSFTEAAVQLVQQQLGELGVAVKLVGGDVASTNAKKDAREYELYMTNITDNDQDVLNTYLNFYNPDAKAQFAANGLGDLLAQQRGIVDVDERNQLVAEAQTQTIDEGWMIPLFDYRQIVAHDKNLQGTSFDSLARPYLYDSWLAK